MRKSLLQWLLYHPTSLDYRTRKVTPQKKFFFNYYSVRRYLSRCILIEFHAPCLELSIKSYAKLPTLLEKSTSGVGFFISLGEAFKSRGINEMDEVILPNLRKILEGVVSRVPLSYTLFLWFTIQVSITCTNMYYSCAHVDC